MAILTLWIKRLILLVLLATFLDLLLPSNAYQRYVRLVMGLCILLTMLLPILEFFGSGNASLNAFPSMFGQEQSFSLDSARMEDLTKQLMTTQDETAAQYVEEQVGEAVKNQVEEEYAVDVDSVQVKVNQGVAKEKEPIQEITVVLAKGGGERTDSRTPSSVQMQPVKPVSPVKIEIGKGMGQQTNQQSVAVMETKSPLQKKIESSLTASWRAPVHVRMLGTGEGD